MRADINAHARARIKATSSIEDIIKHMIRDMAFVDSSIDFTKPRRVLRGPLYFFESSFIVEFLEPDEADGTFFLRATIPAKHPLVKLEKKHPITPPLHIHLDQTEVFHVQQGRWGATSGYDQRNTIITAGKTFAVPPMLPHTVWPVSCDDEDTIIYAVGQPRGVPKPLDNDFFDDLLAYLSLLHDTKQTPDILQLVLANNEARSISVILPGWSFLGPARWWVPYQLEGAVAALARLMGYSKQGLKEKGKKSSIS